MELKTKPDFADVKERWNAFWQGEVIDRPMVCAEVCKNENLKGSGVGYLRYWNPCHGEYEKHLDLLDKWVENTIFMGDMIPHVSPDHGPDQFGAWLGSQLKFNPERKGTNWAEPIIEEWNNFLPITLKNDNPVWQSVLKYSELLRDRGKGKYLVGMADLHSHMDAFSALRHPDKLCLDLYDQPEMVLQGCQKVRDLYPKIYEKLYEVGGMSCDTGTIGWLPLWCEGKTAVVQCDFSVFLGNDLWRQFVLPGIEQETEYLDRCFYHMDGIQQITQLDDLLALPKLDGIQWVPGAGQPEMFSAHWRNLLKQILAGGKKIIVYGNINLEAVKDIHRELGAQGVVYQIFGQNREAIEEIIKWLECNT